MNVKETMKDYLMITFGSIICAIAIYFFIFPSNISVGSVTGLALVIEKLVPLPLSVITFVLNAALLVVGFILIGKDFGVKTVYSSLILPVILGAFEIMFPDFESIMQDQFIDLICYLFMVAVGQAIMFNCNASSGGLDIVGKVLNKYFRMELGSAIAMVGMLVVALSAFVNDPKTVVLGFLGTYLSGIILDHFLVGFNIKKRVCFISNKEDEIVKFILNDLHSGATYYQATGAYDMKSRREVITILTQNEYTRLMNFISKTDPDAFVTVYTVNEVLYKPKTR